MNDLQVFVVSLHPPSGSAQYARQCPENPTVTHCNPRPHVAVLVQASFSIDGVLRDAEAKAHAKGAHDTTQVVVQGEAMKGLLKVADDYEADVLVMGNHQLTGPVSALIGSISTQVSRKTFTHLLLVH